MLYQNLLGVKNSSSHTQKTGSWYLLRVFFNFQQAPSSFLYGSSPSPSPRSTAPSCLDSSVVLVVEHCTGIALVEVMGLNSIQTCFLWPYFHNGLKCL